MDSLDIVFGFTSIVYSILTIVMLTLVIIGCILMACINSIFRVLIEAIIDMIRTNFSMIAVFAFVITSFKLIAMELHYASYNSRFNSLMIRLSLVIG